MDNDNCLVKMQDEKGNEYDMLILKEFSHNNKRYAILTEFDTCNCSDECCDKKDKDHKCDSHHHECNCEEEPIVCLLEITKDEDGKEIFKSIDDDKLFEELASKADKILYED